MSDLSDTTAVILAGGLGTRLRAVLADRPKVLAEVRGRPFITYLLDQVAAAGVHKVVLCTGYLGDQVRDRLGVSYNGLTLEYSQESQPMGTGGALRQAFPLLESSEVVLVLNGDSYCSVNLGALAAAHRRRKASASMVLCRVTDTSRYGQVEIDSENRVLRFQEKEASSGGGLVNGGIYLMARERIASLPGKQPLSLEREVFPSWVRDGLHGFPCDGRLWDIGVPESLERANLEFSCSQQG